MANSQYRRRETIVLNPVHADITEDAFEENVCKTSSLTEVNVVSNNLRFSLNEEIRQSHSHILISQAKKFYYV